MPHLTAHCPHGHLPHRVRAHTWASSALWAPTPFRAPSPESGNLQLFYPPFSCFPIVSVILLEVHFLIQVIKGSQGPCGSQVQVRSVLTRTTPTLTPGPRVYRSPSQTPSRLSPSANFRVGQAPPSPLRRQSHRGTCQDAPHTLSPPMSPCHPTHPLPDPDGAVWVSGLFFTTQHIPEALQEGLPGGILF